MNKEYPKVLFISHNSFSKAYNNGKTYKSFFYGWPKENLAQLYFREEEPDFTVCENFFKITDADIIKKKKQNVGNKVYSTEEKSEKIVHNSISTKEPKTISYILRDIVWSFDKWKNSRLIEWIDEFSPEVIFFVGGGNLFSYKITEYISKKYKLPILLYYTDDYLTLPQKKYSVEWFRTKLLNECMKKFNTLVKEIFVISDEMKVEFESKFHKKCTLIMNCVNIQDFDTTLSIEKNVLNTRPIKLAYFGGLHLNRWKTLKLLGNNIKILNSNKQIMQVDIYSAQKIDEEILAQLNISPHMNFLGAVDSENIIAKMSEYDILIHVESFDPEMVFKTRLSISTKIPEYLASSKPILYIGPESISSANYLKKNTETFFITNLDTEDIQKSLNTIVSLKSEFGSMGEKNKLVAIENHNEGNEREKIRRSIQNSILQ